MISKLVVILGPTSSGKSALGIKLAQKFNGEIVSADSRQVYKNLDLGTGKVTKREQRMVPHHLLDIVSAKQQFSAAEFQRAASKTIASISSRQKLPFLVGGTPFWIYAVVDGIQIPEVKPDLRLRKKLEKKSPAELFRVLKKLDPRRAQNIDRNNPRRLIRAIEIVKSTGQPVPTFSTLTSHPSTLILGIKKELPALYKLIDKRLEKRIKQGLVSEVKKLRKQGVSFKRLKELGLEYRHVSEYLLGEINYQEMRSRLKTANHKYAKRQITWFKSDPRIKWITNQKQAEKLVRNYLRK